MAATKIEDHVVDGDGWVARLPTFFSALGRRWKKAACRLAGPLGFDVATIERQADEQGSREATPGRDFRFYSEPTELAVAAVFEQTALIAERPENRQVLGNMGRLFGRLVLLLDSYNDLDQDRREGHWNALTSSYAGPEIQAAARRIFAEAHAGIRQLFPRLELRQPELARRLLIDELARIGRRTLGVTAMPAAAGPDGAALAEDDEQDRKESYSTRDCWLDHCCSGRKCCPCDCCCCVGECCSGCGC